MTLRRSALLLPILAFACGERFDPRIASLERGLSWLVSRQGDDGSLDSKGALTAAALYAFSLCPERLREEHAAFATKSLRFLTHRPTDHPVYGSAFYLLALCKLRPAGWRKLADAEVAFLRGVQCTEQTGGKLEDVRYGGFGPKQVDISTTSWALEALKAAGVAHDDLVMLKARVFAMRCQHETGGFLHTTVSPKRTQPYGTADCDGFRALLVCDDPESPAALRKLLGYWNHTSHGVDVVPGLTNASDFTLAESLLYYYLASLARVCVAADNASALLSDLHQRVRQLQREDGSWRNARALRQENDPLVATTLALIALATQR